jgi:hypothetical protein
MMEFVIDEISFVDRPAQEGAIMTIIKHYAPNSFDSFEKRIEDIAARDGISKLDSMRRARVEYPREFEEYQRQGAVSYRPSFEKKTNPLAVQEFEVLIEGIALQERVGRDEAMRRARRRHPEKFERYQVA